MRRLASPRLRAWAVLAVAGLVGGVASGRPELVAIAAPFVLLLTAGLVGARDLSLTVGITVDRDRALEGEDVGLSVALSSDVAPMPLDVSFDLPDGISIGTVDAGGRRLSRTGNRICGVVPGVGEPRLLTLTLRCEHWGAHRLGPLRVHGRGALGLFVYQGEYQPEVTIRVFPDPATVRRLLRPVETQLGFGDLVSRRKGEGVEFADLRPMVPGDDPRYLNWRASSRGRGEFVSDRHPERNSDVVLLIDTLVEPRRGVEVTIDLVVRAAAGLAAGHLRRHDRVGLISFGEPLRWLQPGMGDVQRFRILDTMLESRSRYQMYWRGVNSVPRRALPAQALIIGLSPLLDDRAINAFADLRGRGFDVAVVEIPAELFLEAPATREAAMARRIWELRRRATRSGFVRHGIATVAWDPDVPFQQVMAEVDAFRRNAARFGA